MTPPGPFDFARTVYSHGWAVLEPNRWDVEREILTRTERLGPGRVAHLVVTGSGDVERPRIRIGVTIDADPSA